MAQPEALVICVECRDVHESHLHACPRCTCTQALPLDRLTDPRPQRDHLVRPGEPPGWVGRVAGLNQMWHDKEAP